MDDFDWHGGAITRATPVTPSYRSTQNVRRFLHAECGAGFKFDRPFMQWIKDGTRLCSHSPSLTQIAIKHIELP